MAIVSGILSNYAEADYLANQDDYIQNGEIITSTTVAVSGEIVSLGVSGEADMVSSHTVSIDAGVIIAAEVQVESAMTSTLIASGLRDGDIDLTITSTVEADGSNGVSGLVEVGIITNWSAQGSPTYQAQLDTQTTFSQTTTSNTLLTAAVDIAATTTANINGGFSLIIGTDCQSTFSSDVESYYHKQRVIVIELQ